MAKRIVRERHGKSWDVTGKRLTREYATWLSIKQRCCNPKEKSYPRYGGRGIRVCRRWMESFQAFYDDMGPRPSGNYSIDRIDNEGNYEPGNCRWATASEQVRNRRGSHYVVHQGRRMPLAEACELTGLEYGTVQMRIQRGWPEERWLQPLTRRRTR